MPDPTGSLSVDQQGPYHWGDTLTFTTTGGKGRGNPMIELALYQDANEDGTVDEDLFGSDLVHVQLHSPDQAFTVGHLESAGVGHGSADWDQPAQGLARLLQYAWKGRQQTITELDRVEIDVIV